MAYLLNSLPLLVKIVVYPPVGDGHHDDEDSEKDNGHQELVGRPHGNRCRLQVAGFTKGKTFLNFRGRI